MSDPTPPPKASIPDEVRAIAARAEAATPGPWWHQVTTACYDVIEGGERTSDSDYIAMMGTDYDGHDTRDAPNVQADSEFIAHARSDIPTLLAALEASERENERLREALNELANLAAEAVTPCDVASGWCCAHHMDATSVVPCDVAQLADALPRLAAALAPSTPPDLREDAP